jgi:hypothetical protein
MPKLNVPARAVVGHGAPGVRLETWNGRLSKFHANVR